MSINKKIMMFCAVSLIAICVFLAERGTASKENENENAESTVQEHVSTGAAVFSGVSGAAVQDAEEDRMTEQKKKDRDSDEADGDAEAASDPGDSGTAAATEAPKEKNADAGKGNKKEQTAEPKSLHTPGRKKEKTAVQGKKGSAAKKDAGSGSGVNMPAENNDASVSSVTAAPVPTIEAAKNECVLQITCSAVLEHMDKLKDSAKKMVPADGIILHGTCPFTEGDTAFDVLKRACAERNILIDYVFTPGFSTYYVKGINQLYEFDCGDESGWMYTVNGKKPDYGCSQYEVKKNDDIVFYYTCER